VEERERERGRTGGLRKREEKGRGRKKSRASMLLALSFSLLSPFSLFSLPSLSLLSPLSKRQPTRPYVFLACSSALACPKWKRSKMPVFGSREERNKRGKHQSPFSFVRWSPAGKSRRKKNQMPLFPRPPPPCKGLCSSILVHQRTQPRSALSPLTIGVDAHGPALRHHEVAVGREHVEGALSFFDRRSVCCGLAVALPIGGGSSSSGSGSCGGAASAATAAAALLFLRSHGEGKRREREKR